MQLPHLKYFILLSLLTTQFGEESVAKFINTTHNTNFANTNTTKIIRCHFHQLTKGEACTRHSSFVENSGSVDIFQHDSIWQQPQLPQSINHCIWNSALCPAVSDTPCPFSQARVVTDMGTAAPGAHEAVTGHEHLLLLRFVVLL